jgi:hypothetical protein
MSEVAEALHIRYGAEVPVERLGAGMQRWARMAIAFAIRGPEEYGRGVASEMLDTATECGNGEPLRGKVARVDYLAAGMPAASGFDVGCRRSTRRTSCNGSGMGPVVRYPTSLHAVLEADDVQMAALSETLAASTGMASSDRRGLSWSPAGRSASSGLPADRWHTASDVARR